MKTGHKVRLWCSQDEGKRQKPQKSKEQGVKHRDHTGMKRYGCCSQLVVTSRAANITGWWVVSIQIQHYEKHPLYYDVEMPVEALEIIRTNLEWSTPVSMVGWVQGLFLNVTAKQIHAAWTRMSEVLWQWDKEQLKSASWWAWEWGWCLWDWGSGRCWADLLGNEEDCQEVEREDCGDHNWCHMSVPCS